MTSLELSKLTKVQHVSIKRLINKYRNMLESFGSIKEFVIHNSEGGRPFEVFNLNNKHKNIIIVFLKNTKSTTLLKIKTMEVFMTLKEEYIKSLEVKLNGLLLKQGELITANKDNMVNNLSEEIKNLQEEIKKLNG